MFETHYGLTGRPFQLTPDPRFYFESATHRKAMSYLGYGLAQGEGFIIITGEIGAGKSTLVAHLMETVDKARLTAAQIVTTQLKGDDLLHMVASSFGVATAGLDKTGTLAAIEHFLHTEARAGRRCLLVVDESQNLPMPALEELRMLSNFQLGSHPLLQIFLLGQPEFRAMVHGSPGLEQLRQRIIATHHLGAMEQHELQPYVEHRMTLVGWTGRPAFADDVWARLFAETGGIPRKVNMLINRVLLMAAVDDRDTVDAALIDAVLADLAMDQMSDEDWQNEAMLASAARHAEQAAPVAPAPEVAAPVAAAAIPEVSRSDFNHFVREVRAFATEQQDARALLVQELQAALDRVDALESRPAPAADVEPLVKRIEALEKLQAEQQKTLHRVLALLVGWVEDDSAGMWPRGQAA
ncbi:MAG: general secretion pathway protein [Blastomonas sp. CACIA14H2]|jgi:general secretion pathway protein A|uniref:XrtA/PEP-CTERM system-associated ATPase n=1 Tax=unclassified Blastomonas TaxID=2626550 RepID=UPI0003D03953|nr:XrtA/PEP-CTERM system-associated ATPase [Blastomonas sp. UPD001]ESZ88486.1 MAG: general secretion pathway protein [Blastomonas sp. CACIA14H2]